MSDVEPESETLDAFEPTNTNTDTDTSTTTDTNTTDTEHDDPGKTTPDNNDADDGDEPIFTDDKYLGDEDTGGSRPEIEDVNRGVLDRVKDRFGKHRRSVTPRKIDDAMRNRITEQVKHLVDNENGRLLRVRPHPDGQGITGGKEIFRELAEEYRTGFFGLRNKSPVQSFEIWMVEGEVAFHFYAHDHDAEIRILQEIDAQYPNASVERVWDAETVQSFVERQLDETTDSEYTYDNRENIPLNDAHIPLPPLEHTQYAAAGEFSMKKSYKAPIMSPDAVEDLDNDPYKSITSSMVADERHHYVVQVTFQPLGEKWATSPFDRLPARKHIDEVAYEWLEERGSTNPSGTEGKSLPSETTHSDIVRRRTKEPGFNVNVRVLALGEDQDIVERGARKVMDAIQSKYQQQKQKLLATPMNGVNLVRTLDHTINRAYNAPPAFPIRKRRYRRYYHFKHQIRLPASEMGSLCHLPNGEVDTPDINWERTRSGAAVPQSAEKFPDAPQEHTPSPLAEKPITTSGGDSEDLTDQEDRSIDMSTNTSSTNEASTVAKTTTDTGDTGETASDTREGSALGIEWLENLIHDDETVQYAEHPSVWVSIPQYLIGLVVALIGIGVGAVTAFNTPIVIPVIETLPPETYAIAAAIIAGGIGYIAYEHVRRRNKWYVVTDERVMKKTGIMQEHAKKLQFADINQTEKRQTLVDRLRGTGNIHIHTAATGGREMYWNLVKNVDRVEGQISKYSDRTPPTENGDTNQ